MFRPGGGAASSPGSSPAAAAASARNNSSAAAAQPPPEEGGGDGGVLGTLRALSGQLGTLARQLSGEAPVAQALLKQVNK